MPPDLLSLVVTDDVFEHVMSPALVAWLASVNKSNVNGWISCGRLSLPCWLYSYLRTEQSHVARKLDSE